MYQIFVLYSSSIIILLDASLSNSVVEINLLYEYYKKKLLCSFPLFPGWNRGAACALLIIEIIVLNSNIAVGT